MENFKQERENPPVEVPDDALEQVSGGSDNYAIIIRDWTVTGKNAASEDASEMMMPVGAITEE